MPESERTYISIDLKSFYAPVECVERTGRDVIPKAALVTPPLTDFWRVGRGIARKLEEHCIFTTISEAAVKNPSNSCNILNTGARLRECRTYFLRT